MSPHDLVSCRICSADDRVSYAQSLGDHELALKRGLRDRGSLKLHSIQSLVDNHLGALLKEGSEESVRFAGVETMRLLGTNRDRWEKWLYAFSRDARSLTGLVPNLPVRDPKLPQSL
jgi:hypothetical protein